MGPRVRTAAALLAAVLPFLAGCGSSSPRFSSTSDPGLPTDEPNSLEGVASYYAHEFNGRPTASGETYDMNGLTAAHRSLPFNTRIRVTNLDNGKSIVVRINDRGPFKEGRIIDLSFGAARLLGMLPAGTIPVKLEILDTNP